MSAPSHDEWKACGRGLMSGFVTEIGKWLLLGLILGVVWRCSDDKWHITPRDSTDAPTERSNLVVRVDHWSGCQYLESHAGQLTPRLDATGKPVCGNPAVPQ